MKNKNSVLSLVFLSFIFMLTIVSAQVPFQEYTGETGVQVVYQKFDVIKANQEFMVHTHVFNLSNGQFLDNTTTSCFLYVSSSNGTIIIDDQMVFEYPYDYTYNINSQLLQVGKGSWIMQCNTSYNTGGFASGEVLITSTGTVLSVGQSIIYSALFLVLIMFFVVSLYGIFKVENVAWKVGSMCFGWIILLSIFLVGWLFALYYVPEIPYFQTVMYIMWLVMMYGFFAFLIGLSAWLMFRAFQESQEKKFMNMGYSSDEARLMARRKRK